jgi:hypothetical protein
MSQLNEKLRKNGQSRTRSKKASSKLKKQNSIKSSQNMSLNMGNLSSVI